jgi:bifunctional DNase/RNase
MTIEGVGFDHLRQTVVVLKDWQGEKLLPIWIGPAEARAIQIELEGAQPVRPLSHDLLLAIIAVVHGRVTRVVINDLQDSTFYATIDIDTPKGTKHIDARPSDALAVAVRAKCPVFVDGGAIGALIDAEEVNGLPDLPDSEVGANSDGDDEEITRFRRLLGDD